MKKQTEIVPQEPTLNIETLISQGIQKGLTVDVMERLLAMRTQLKAEYAKEQFIKSLAGFQKECPTVVKTKKVVFGTTKYNYAPLEDIVEQVKEFLAKNGFSYMFDTETNGKMKVICKVYHIDGHMEPATFDMEIDTSAKMNVSQKYGSALSYAKRYAFCAAFGINVKDEDTDAVSTPPDALVTLPGDIISMISKTRTQKALNGVYSANLPKFTGEVKKLFIAECVKRKHEIQSFESDTIADEVDEALNPKFNNK